MLKRLVIYLTISTIGLTGCSEPAPGDPACRISQQHKDDRVSNAACVIRLDAKLLTVTHAFSGKFDLPGGTSNGNESAQCTAHRETWEETGFNVEVGAWLGENDNGMQYYACTLSGNFDGTIVEFDKPPWSNAEIRAIQLLDPFAITDKQWRYPDRLPQLRAMFNLVSDSKKTI